MTDYRKNSLLEEKVAANPTFGLPLFKGQPATPDAATYRLESAPASVALATDTRKLSHIILKFDRKSLADKQQKVYEVIKEHGPVTNEEIKKILGWEINQITGRTWELRHFGLEKRPLVVPDIKRLCTVTGNMATPWKANEQFSVEDINEEV
jgi:hypothetical protein